MKPRLAYDPAVAFTHLRAADPSLAALIDRIGPFTLVLTPTKSLFEALLRSIIYQQLHAKAAAAIHQRVLAELAKQGGTTPESSQRITDPAFRKAGLSANKLHALRDLANKFIAGTVPSLSNARRLSDEELVSRLTEVRGIGPWTVHMLLIFHLGRPDVMPTGDFAIRLAFQRLFRKRREPSPAIILRHARSWQPYRSVACWYLWRSLDKT